MSVPEQLGPFKLTRLLGRGGMGAVYLGEHADFLMPVAVKVLLASSGNSDLRQDRFDAEIDTLRRLRHPNIVSLLGYGEDSGYRYFAMEYVDGPSLESEIHRKRRFTWEEAVHIGVHISRALRHAHDRGIVHRDIKPANILLSVSGEVKVSDYGIARLFGGGRMTAVDTVIGTLDYMSPEQASAGPITPKSDLFSLGALLYVLLTGSPPFPLEKKSLPVLLSKFREGPPESSRFRRPDIPRDLDLLLLDLLQIHVDKRPANALLVQRRLESILESYAANGGLARLFTADGTEHKDEGSRIDLANPSTGGSKTLRSTGAPFSLERADLENRKPDGDTGRTVTTDVLAPKQETAEQRTGWEPNSQDGSGLSFEVAEPNQEQLPLEKEEGQTGPPRTSQYVRVSEEEFDPYSASEEKSPFLSFRVILLSLVLVTVGGSIMYSLRPPTADQLSEKIEKKLRNIDPEDDAAYVSHLRAIDDEIALFLSAYPNDPRVDRVRLLQADLDMAALENRVIRLAERSNWDTEFSSPIEAAYVEAYSVSEHDRDEGIKKFKAFLNIFETLEDSSRPLGVPSQALRLARKRLSQLEKSAAHQTALEQEFVRDRLETAESLEETDPDRAARIREGLKEFYGGRPWAKEIIDY